MSTLGREWLHHPIFESKCNLTNKKLWDRVGSSPGSFAGTGRPTAFRTIARYRSRFGDKVVAKIRQCIGLLSYHRGGFPLLYSQSQTKNETRLGTFLHIPMQWWESISSLEGTYNPHKITFWLIADHTATHSKKPAPDLLPHHCWNSELITYEQCSML